MIPTGSKGELNLWLYWATGSYRFPDDRYPTLILNSLLNTPCFCTNKPCQFAQRVNLTSSSSSTYNQGSSCISLSLMPLLASD